MQNETFKLQTNVSATITFKSPTPIKTGQSQYGDWVMYSIIVEEIEKVFFPSIILHNQIQKEIYKSKTLIITKKEDTTGSNGRGAITIYSVEVPKTLNNSIEKFTSQLSQSTNEARQNDQDKIWEAKDKRIARMSVLKTAVEFGSKDLDEVFSNAEKMFNFVYEIDKTKELLEAMDIVDNKKMEEIPF